MTERTSPYDLWQQAKGDREEYLRLMAEHGHLIPGKRGPDTDIFGHAAWRTPSVGSLDLDTLLYVRESIAGIIAVDRGRPFIDALPLIDEIIRLREAAPTPAAPLREAGGREMARAMADAHDLGRFDALRAVRGAVGNLISEGRYIDPDYIAACEDVLAAIDALDRAAALATSTEEPRA